jgi:hypothetical protein
VSETQLVFTEGIPRAGVVFASSSLLPKACAITISCCLILHDIFFSSHDKGVEDICEAYGTFGLPGNAPPLLPPQLGVFLKNVFMLTS